MRDGITSDKLCDFGADLDHDRDPGIFKGILPLQDRTLVRIVGSVALAEVCGLRVLLVIPNAFSYLLVCWGRLLETEVSTPSHFGVAVDEERAQRVASAGRRQEGTRV